LAGFLAGLSFAGVASVDGAGVASAVLAAFSAFLDFRLPRRRGLQPRSLVSLSSSRLCFSRSLSCAFLAFSRARCSRALSAFFACSSFFWRSATRRRAAQRVFFLRGGFFGWAMAGLSRFGFVELGDLASE